MKLLNITASNTKIAKSQKSADIPTRIASLSLYPDPIICAGSKAAGCMDGCLKSAGRGRFDNVANARRAKTQYWHDDKDGFLEQLEMELSNFQRLCKKTGVKGVVRLNTISDIAFERYGIPQSFPDLYFYDYTKRVDRIGKTPKNYDLIFSYSARPQYAKQVAKMPKNNPMAVVFRDDLPATFMGKPVIDGDLSDLVNVKAAGKIVGLRAKGKAKKDASGFVVDCLPVLEVA